MQKKQFSSNPNPSSWLGKIILAIAFAALFFVIVFSAEFIDTSQSDFNKGDFNGTRATSDGNLMLINRNSTDLNFSGDYNSQRFDANADANWDNLFWNEGYHYFEQLPSNAVDQQPDGNMTGNILLLHFNDKNANNGVDDNSGQNNHAQLFNGADINASGRFDTNALFLDGFDDFAEPRNESAFDFGTGAFTVSLWARNMNVSNTTASQGILTKDSFNGLGNGLYISATPGGQYAYWNGTVDTSIGASRNAFDHIAVTRTGTGANGVNLFYNGVLVNSLTDSRTLANDIPMYIGSFGDSNTGDSTWFKGLIEEIAVFNRAISESEVLNHYRRAVNRLRLQVRGCNDANCVGELFVGPDGGTSTYFTDGNRNWDLNRFDSNRYFQYRVLMDTNDTNISKLGVSTLRLLDVNITYISYNTAPDGNITRIDNNPDTQALPNFSYNSDGNLTIDFNVSDDSNNMLIDLNFSTSSTQGTGTVIIDDVNFSRLPLKCDDLNFKNSTKCSWDWNISGVSDGTYYILMSTSDGSLTDFNASENSFLVDNSAPDVNVTRIDGNPDTQTLPNFSYNSDGNLTIDFNVTEDDTNSLLVDLNYSTSNSQGTGTVIIADLNLNNQPTKCDDLNFKNSTKCSWDWNIHSSLVNDGTYYILVSASNGSLKGFDASNNTLRIDNSATTPARPHKPVCGDGFCNRPETPATCPKDCRGRCGDSICTGSETADTCPLDCVQGCGNRVCEEKENCLNCQIDCGVCKVAEERKELPAVKPTGAEQKIDVEAARKAFAKEGISQEIINNALQYSKNFSYDREITVTKQATSVTIGIVNNSDQTLADVIVAEIVLKSLSLHSSQITTEAQMFAIKQDPVVQFIIPKIRPSEKMLLAYTVGEEKQVRAEEFASPIILSWRQFVGEVSCATACNDFNPCTIDKCINNACINFLAEDSTACGYGMACKKGACILQPFSETKAKAGIQDLFMVVIILVIFTVMAIAYFSYRIKKIKSSIK